MSKLNDYDNSEFKAIKNINDLGADPETIKHIECELFITALTDNYNVPNNVIESIRSHWEETDFQSRDSINRPRPHGFIISNSSIKNKIFKHINSTALIGFNYDDCFNSQDVKDTQYEHINSAILESICKNNRDIIKQEAEAILEDVINKINDYLYEARKLMSDNKDKTREERRHLIGVLADRFENDDNIAVPMIFSTVRFTFTNYEEAVDAIRQGFITHHQDDDDYEWLKYNFAVPSLYDYVEALMLSLV